MSKRPRQGIKASQLSVKRSEPESKRREASSGSSNDVDELEERQTMLAALQAHGRAFFGMDHDDEAETSEQGRMRMSESAEGSSDGDEDEFISDDGWVEEGDLLADQEDALTGQQVPEVIFAPTSTSSDAALSKAERRAFLGGSVSKMMGTKVNDLSLSKRQRHELLEDDAEDQSNMKLDKTLHDMLLTNLLPTSDASASRRPVDKRKAVSGRLLELAQIELPGKGANSLKSKQLSSHPAKIRTGIMHAQTKKAEQARREAESASWVKGMGHTKSSVRKTEKGREKRAGLGIELGKKKGMDGRKDAEQRGKGLKMGVGKFRNGMLTLSEREVARGFGELKSKHRGGRRR